MGQITGSNVAFHYQNDCSILENMSFSIRSGEMTAILGKNGCGKSTLIKLITALLPLSGGNITLDGMNISEKKGIREVRRRCGIVFQNPDNQFVSPVVEDDIRFGLDNHAVPESEQPERIRNSLEKVRLEGFENRNVATLSGGQKQRAAAAGVIALQNDILIFDEATSMLDPQGAADILSLIDSLRAEGKTIILVTQNIQDVITADRILLMADGCIIRSGTPREILTDPELLKKAGVQVPFAVRVWDDLRRRGIDLPRCPLTAKELAGEICSLNLEMSA